jgi:predicted ATPase/DNA-binding SARP family transcriptional activator
MGSDVRGRLAFGVLGPLELRRDGEPVALGGERQRALLAVLLVRANELVRVEELVDQLFGEQRSEAAIGALRVAVSRLRRLLGDDVLLTRAGGYVLQVGPEQLDATVFERLFREGQRLLACGDPAPAAERLRQGLALWRGAPLGDVSQLECFQGEIRRLEELRLMAVMERIESELALGAAGELIGELDALIATNPLQERLRGQLMLALYRAGRQAEALEVYRQTSELLRDELGLEPSRQLRELERSVLQQEASLEPVTRPASAPSTRLPAPATPFLGRARELGDVTSLLRREDTRMLTLTGAGGSGKTRLALRAADELESDYRDGACFVGFADITDPELIAPTLCQALELKEQLESTPLERLSTGLEDRQVLLVLDNLEQLAEGTGVLGELLARCRGVRMLVTSREPLRLTGERQYGVPVLCSEDAVQLFTTRAHAVKPDLKIDSDLAGQICERLDCLPLAIELAAARTKALSPSEILARLDQRLPVLTGGPRDAPRRQRALRAAIDWSYDLLNSEEQCLFARLAVFAGGCTLAAADAVCRADLDTLQALVDRSLVRAGGERYSMLQTIREYALEKLEQTGQVETVLRAHAQWLVDVLDAAGAAPPGWPGASSLNRLRQERENFRVALEWASNTDAFDTLARLVSALSAVWVVDGQLHEAQRWITLVLQHQDAYSGRLAAQVISAARRLARHQGKESEAAALAARALELWQEIGDPEAIGRAMVDVGFTAVSARDLAEGRRVLEDAIRFARANTLSAVLPAGLNNLADFEILEGHLNAGRVLCEESLTVSAQGCALADIALINLAYIENLEGNTLEAISSGSQALDSALRRGDLLWVAWAAIALAWPLAEQGQLERAGQLLGAALAFLETAGAGKDWMDEVGERAVREILRERLGAQAAQTLLEEGRHVPLERAARNAIDDDPCDGRPGTDPKPHHPAPTQIEP